MYRDDAVKEAVLSAPPVSVAGLSLAGVSLQDWVLIVTLIWLSAQLSWFAYSRYKDFTDGRKKKE